MLVIGAQVISLASLIPVLIIGSAAPFAPPTNENAAPVENPEDSFALGSKVWVYAMTYFCTKSIVCCKFAFYYALCCIDRC